MLHLIFDGRPWFAAKRYGFGVGLPIAWQGWVMIAAQSAVIIGLLFLLRDRPVELALSCFFAALAPMPLYAAKTQGGWHWRWGGRR